MSRNNQKSAKSGKRKIRYAIVGLGHIAQAAVLPAFAHATKNAELVALVSGDGAKLKKLGRKYNVENLYSYEQFDECLGSGKVDAVYIALPNHLHAEYAIRAARAGVHILCEKPMAPTPRECERMIDAAEKNNVRLMIAYRLHFDAANLEAIKIAQSGKLGEVRLFNSVFTQDVRAGDIRLQTATAGGTLWDIGIYCLNAARYLLRAEPTEVFASTASRDQARFAEVEEMTSVTMRFPDERLATFICSFGAARTGSYHVVGTKGDLAVDPAYGYVNDVTHKLTVNGKTKERTFPKHDQFAAELIYFADCILNNRNPEPSGAEGLIDVRIVEALYRSARTGKPVKLTPPTERKPRPLPKQAITRPPVEEEPELVEAKPPTKKNKK